MKTRNAYFRPLFAGLSVLALAATSASAATIAATGWNVDGILSTTETYATHDKPFPNSYIWYQQGDESATVARPGLATTGAVTVNGTDFQLQSQSYSGDLNNVLRSTGTLTLATPGQYSELFLLGSTSGSATPTIRLNFADATNSGFFSFTSFVGWTVGLTAQTITPGLTNTGTSNSFNGTMSVSTINLTPYAGKTLVSMDFTGANSNVFAVSGIPEPSIALLGGLGVLCLLRRRR